VKKANEVKITTKAKGKGIELDEIEITNLRHSPVLPRQESDEERGILDNNDHDVVNSNEEETDKMK